jgi:sulfite exporter TauE/SafE
MSDGGVFTALATAAVSVAALHTLAPDHWAPFAAVARARGWSAGRTARVTLLCGFGHVTASALLGLLALFFGIEVLQSVGKRMEALAGILLIAFGLIYAAWGLRRAAGAHFHGHVHHHYDHVHKPERTTVWSLFLLFSADPCVAVMPILFAAAPLGAVRTTAIVLLYEAATLITMVLLVLPARAGVKLLRFRFLDKYGDATAGGAIAAVGLAVMLLGL